MMTSPYFIRRQTCPACNSENHNRLYSCKFQSSPIREYLESFYLPQGKIEFTYLNDSYFILNECEDCSLIYQEEIPNNILMGKIYEEWINPVKAFDIYTKATHFGDYLYFAQEIMSIIAYFRAVPGQLQFLDFGMGWGTWARIAKALGCQSYGTEISDVRIKHSESNGIKVVTREILSNYRFHFINTEQVFEHLSHPLETLIHLKNCLHPKGLIKISVPDGTGIKRKLVIGDWKAPKNSRHSLNPVAPLEHINCFNHQSVMNMASLTSLKRVRLPLHLQYAYSIYGNSLSQIIKNVLRPVYRNFFNKTYLFFKKIDE